jgi:transcriptional regulator with XRE-family HTH domain
MLTSSFGTVDGRPGDVQPDTRSVRRTHCSANRTRCPPVGETVIDEARHDTVGLEGDRPTPAPDAAEVRARVAATVRDLRARSGRSLAELATAAGIGKSTLHAIESGDANPSIETLWALAGALAVPFGDLLDPPKARVRVVRGQEAPRVESESSTMQAHLLTATARGARVELFTLDVDPGSEREAEPHSAGTVEHVLVTSGQLRVGPSSDPALLDPGDLATFAGDAPHVYEATRPGTHAVLLVEYP